MSDTDQSEPKKPEPDNGAPSAFGNQPPETGQPGGMVLFNGKSAVHAGSNGTLTTTDPCWTKIGKSSRVVPYINVAKSADADNTAATVFINGHPACHLRSTFSKSTGDEAGYAGVKSGTIQGKAEFLTSSPNVYIEGIPAVRQHDLMVSNNRNTPPAPLMQPGNTQDLEDAILRAEEVLDGPPPDAVVVEVAGVNKQLVFGYIGIGDRRDNPTKERLVPAGGDDDEHGHYQRVSIGSAPGEYETYLVLWDSIGDAYRIPIDKISTVKRENPPENTHVLVPVTPLVYTTADRDPQQADMCRKGGWIYVFRNGKLWRECRVINHFSLKDVNLDQHRGKTHRPAECGADAHLLLVHKANGTVQKNEVAFSEVQWSWERIAAMEKSAKLRSERLVKVDLSGYGGGFPLIEAAPGTARVENGANAPDVFALIHDRKSDIPVVYLDDPIGIARRLAVDYQLAWKDMADCLYKLKSAPERCKADGNYDPQRWYEAAALANRYFYSDISDQVPPSVQNKADYQQRLQKTRDQFERYKLRLDKAAIDRVLGVEDRKQIRERIKATKQDLISYLRPRFFDPDPADGVSIITALDDYFTLALEDSDPPNVTNIQKLLETQDTPPAPPCYGHGFRVVADIIADLAKHEYTLDNALEANPPNGWALRKQDPGFLLLADLSDPNGKSPLHTRLFPAALGGVNPLALAAVTPEKDDPAFKPQYFAWPYRRPWKVSTPAMAHFCRHFDEVAAMRDDKNKAFGQKLTRCRESVLRLVNAVLDLELEYSQVAIDDVIAFKETSPSESVDIFALLRRTTLFIDKARSAAGDDAVMTKLVTSGKHLRLDVLAKRFGKDATIKLGLAHLVGIVEAVNFMYALRAFYNSRNSETDWLTFAKMVGSFTKLTNATAKVAENLYSSQEGMAAEGALGKLVGEHPGAARVQQLRFLNVIGKFIGMGLSYLSMMENISQNDDAAMGDAITGIGYFLGLVAIVGGALCGTEGLITLFGLSLPLSVIATVGSAVELAGYLAKAFLFTEDSPIEIWLANGPFASDMVNFDTHKRLTPDGNETRYRETHGASELVVDPDNRIVGLYKSKYGSGTLFEKPDGTIIRKTSDGEVVVGKIGQEPNPQTLTDPVTRFGGHKAGDDPMVHAKVPTKAGHEWVNDPNPDQHDKYRLAQWCEDPHVAYQALADAMYRPRVSLRVDRLSFTLHDLQLAIHLPYFIDGQSILHYRMEMQVNGRVVNSEVREIRSFESGKAGPVDYSNNWAVSENGLVKLMVKVRLDVFGDEKLCLPVEPLFSEDTIIKEPAETQGGKDHPGNQPKKENKWIVAHIFTKIEMPSGAYDRYPKMI